MGQRARRRSMIVAGGTALAGIALAVPGTVGPPEIASSGTAAASTTVAASSTSAARFMPNAPGGAQPGGPVSSLTGPVWSLTDPVTSLLGPTAATPTPRTAGDGARSGLSHPVSGENWAGYAATGGTYSSVSSTWTEPTGDCSAGNGYSAFWVGLDGYSSPSVEQTGSEFDCTGGTPAYSAWYELYPANAVYFNEPVTGGDRFTGTVSYSGGTFTLTISDTTQGWRKTVTEQVPDATRNSAEAIAEAPCCTNAGNPVPLADFGTVPFTGTTVDGAPIGNSAPTAIDMVSPGGAAEASVSPLSGGENFDVTWDSAG